MNLFVDSFLKTIGILIFLGGFQGALASPFWQEVREDPSFNCQITASVDQLTTAVAECDYYDSQVDADRAYETAEYSPETETHFAKCQYDINFCPLDSSFERLWCKKNGQWVESSDCEKPPLEAPPHFRVISEMCYGFNSASWDGVDGATHYELWSCDPYSYLIRKTSQTFTMFNVGKNTYVKVRACNEKGCGPFSDCQLARYYPSCR